MGVHMANMIKSSIYGGDAAFLSDYFDHLFSYVVCLSLQVVAD